MSVGLEERKLDGGDLRLKLQKKSNRQDVRGQGVRDLRDLLSGSMHSQQVKKDAPKPKPAPEAPKPVKRNITVEPPVADVKKISDLTLKKKSQQKADASVDDFLQSLGLEKYQIIFQAEEVDMTALEHMTDEDLKAMGLQMSKVPKFGAWEGAQGADNFTVYFDSARKNKNNGQKINPNDPEENPDLFPQYAGSSQAQPKPEPSPTRVAEPKPQGQGQARPVGPAPQGGRAKVPQFGAWNGGEGTQYTAYFETARKTRNDGGEPAMNRDVSEKVRAPPVTKVRTEPPREDVARNVSRGSTSSMPSSDSLGKQTSVPKPTAQPKANPQPRHQAAAGVPQFGAWNNNATSQPEGYTVAFARAKEDRKTPLHANAPPSYNQPPPYNNQKQGSCCSIL